MRDNFLRRRRRARAELERRLYNLRRADEIAVKDYKMRSSEQLYSIINDGENAHAELRLVTAVGSGRRAETHAASTCSETGGTQRRNKTTDGQGGFCSRLSVPSRPSVSNPLTRWETIYHRAVRLTDLVVMALALSIGLLATEGLAGSGILAAVTATVLTATMLCCRAWEGRILGQGTEEIQRLVNVIVVAIVVLALWGLASDISLVRPWVFGVLPLTGVALLVTRNVLRCVLHAHRRRGRCMYPVLAAGSLDEVADLIERTRRERHYGWEVVAACVPGEVSEIRGVPIVGDLSDVAENARHGGYRVVAVAPAPHWTRRRLRELAWELEGAAAELVVAPALMEVTGPRLHVAPIYGLTLLRVSKPTFTGPRWALKAAIDRVIALTCLLCFSPAFLAIALAIKLEDGGPVLFRQVRVGKNGRLLTMLKFRSMVVDAEARLLDEANEKANEGAGPLFKLRRDPRVTRVGAALRRYSLDELPQLLNVLVGDMSLVGPRPPLPVEVESYGFDARRRLLVKPGLTGLWQVSGRSCLSWEEAVRLDLRYVENWSLTMDAVIMWKTASAVLRSDGAY